MRLIHCFSFKVGTLQNYLRDDQLSWPLWMEGGKLMDAIDAVVLDHLIQNLDRHIYYFEPVKYGSLLLLDHGKGLVLCLKFILFIINDAAMRCGRNSADSAMFNNKSCDPYTYVITTV